MGGYAPEYPIFLAYKIGFILFPKSEKPQFLINIEAGAGSNIYETNNINKQIEEKLGNIEEIEYYSSNVGRGNPRIFYNEVPLNEAKNYSQIFVQLKTTVKPKEKAEIISILQNELTNIPNSNIVVKDFEQGLPLEAPVAIRIFGDNLDTLKQLSFEVENIIRGTEGTMYVNNPMRITKTDIITKINKDKAGLLGVPTAEIDKMIRLAVSGLNLGKIKDSDGYEYDLIITVPKKNNIATYSTIEDLYINTINSTMIPLSFVCDIEFEKSYSIINHLDKKRYTTITAYVQDGYLPNNINNKLSKSLKKHHFPDGYHHSVAGEVENTQESFAGFGSVLIICMFLFLAILILEFKSFKSLIIVLSVVPLGIIGAVLILFLAGQSLSFGAIIGIIALIGIEIKNSILLVDFTNELRKNGMDLDQAIIVAGEIRFIPILLTAATAISGLIPLVVIFNPLYSPVALVIIGGLLTSTFLSRIMTPVMYKLFPPKLV